MVAAIASAASAVIGAAGSAYGASQQASAAEQAANTQAEAAQSAAQLQLQSEREGRRLQLKMFRQIRHDQQPYRQIGKEAVGQLREGTLTQGGQFQTPFTLKTFQEDPGYQFRLQQGQQALERGAAARGMLFSGAQGQALQEYGQDLGSQEYGNAYNRFQTDRTARFNRLAALGGFGQTSLAQTGQAGVQTGQSVAGIGQASAANRADLLTQAANARASGYVGAANAWNQGISGIGNAAAGGLNSYLTLRALQQPTAYSQRAYIEEGL